MNLNLPAGLIGEPGVRVSLEILARNVEDQVDRRVGWVEALASRSLRGTR